MKKKGKQFRQSYSYKKLYLDDLKNIVDIFDEKLISHNISDENVEYDNFEEFISFNKDNKQVKKLYFNGHKNINVPAQHVKSEIEFKLELSKYNGAVITCDDEENTKEIRLLLEDVLERNRMWLFYILSFIVVLVNIFLIVFVISIILAFANIQFIKGVIDPITHEYGAYGYLFLLWGIPNLYFTLPNKIQIYLFNKKDKYHFIKVNKEKIIWKIIEITIYLLAGYFISRL